MSVRVVTDSTSYIPPDRAAELGIRVVDLSVTLDGVTEAETGTDVAGFFRRVEASGSFPTTSQPSVADLVAALEEPAAAGDAVVGVFISSRMSGTHDTALMARDQVLERHPEADIRIVDSRSNSMEEGFAVLAAARAAKAGEGADRAVAAALATIARTRWLFTPATLEYLRRGGRIGNASALLGTLLQIHPVLTVVDGVTSQMSKVRTHRKALETIADLAAADFAAHGYVDAVVHHAVCPEDGEALAAMVEARSGHRPAIAPLGPAIASHVGPGALGIVYQCVDELHKNTAEGSS